MTGVDPATRAALADLNARFAWSLDRHRYEDLRDVLAPDVHYVGAGGELTGVEAVIASFRARTGPRTTRHGLGNLLLTPAGDGRVTALSSWHTFASNSAHPRGVGLYQVADFADVYARGGDGDWRIAERVIRPVFREPGLAPGPGATSGGAL
ncbi:nuclear transport factor 2 family protein [Umezawaea tangerina]|uniref:SnoaL-like protein n=1 Tax=Umezawaea tangerina TaxID=84725 RepID=A0A2T0T6R0_9PSEU|nr:nuclear transport factor 2 family protein [Umezawaea tangerina]PRY41312.1 SnoaL-like protein [Umezawaea tangerina]